MNIDHVQIDTISQDDNMILTRMTHLPTGCCVELATPSTSSSKARREQAYKGLEAMVEYHEKERTIET